MCYNITYIEKRIDRYIERYKDVLPPDWGKSVTLEALPELYFVSGFTHPLLPIVKHDGAFFHAWGLIPSWVKEQAAAQEIRTKTLNSVGETVFEKASFRSSIARKRCLLGINGFFEWRDYNGKKYPYFIRVKGDELFSLGCIYDDWIDRATGEMRNTFSILTTPANPMMERIHNLKKRMPLIIAREDERHWINPFLPTEDIRRLIKPYPDSDMEAYTISTDANSPRKNRNVPEILTPVRYPELP